MLKSNKTTLFLILFCKDALANNYVLGNEDHVLFAYAVIQMLTTHTSYFQFFSSGFICMKHVHGGEPILEIQLLGLAEKL